MKWGLYMDNNIKYKIIQLESKDSEIICSVMEYAKLTVADSL